MRLGWVGMEGVRASSSSWAIEMGKGDTYISNQNKAFLRQFSPAKRMREG